MSLVGGGVDGCIHVDLIVYIGDSELSFIKIIPLRNVFDDDDSYEYSHDNCFDKHFDC